MAEGQERRRQCQESTSAGGGESESSRGIENDTSELQDTSQSGSCTPPPKRKRYLCVFRKTHTKTFPWATESKRGRSWAYCMRCSRDINMGPGGVKDLKRHEMTALHSRAEESCVGARPLSTYFGPARREATIEAEVKFGYFLGEHHLALSLADHATKLFVSMFSDSTIAKDFKCGRTKATAILKVIAQDMWMGIASALSNSEYFSLQVDETTDMSVTQQMAIMLRFFDNSHGSVRCVFFRLESVERATADQLFLHIDKNIREENHLSYDKLIGLGTDGANVMLGQRNSVLSRLRAKQPCIISLHCNCHIAALIANYSCKVMPNELEELTTDVWYYFQKSPKRLREFEQFQAFLDVKPHKLLKSCSTRWLSLEACVVRLIEQYDALLSYFRSTEDKRAVVKRVKSVLEKPTTMAYLLFLSSALPVINNFNKLMQHQGPIVHRLQQELDGLVRKLMFWFLKAKTVSDASDVGEIDLDEINNYLPLDEVFIGHRTAKYLEDNDSLSTSDAKKFREVCSTFWLTAVKEAMKRLPLAHPILSNLKWLQPGSQDYSRLPELLSVADSLPQVVGQAEKPTLQEEFMDFCTFRLPDCATTQTVVDKYWHSVSEVIDLSGEGTRFPTLSKLAKAVALIPHGNADTERLFSHIGLNKTKHRNSLSLETLNSLLTIQFNKTTPCYEFKPSNDLVKRCKNAQSEVHTT